MPWAKFDDRFPWHRKVRRISDTAFRLHVSAVCWCSEHLTDGFIPTTDVEIVSDVKRVKPAITTLVTAGLWDEVPGGWMIHDYLDYNPAKDDVESNREWDRKRQALYRDKALVDAVKKRDQDRCRYCAQLVSWTDRRSTLGGQLDHVIPRGPNTTENIVVACRGCNTRKGGRTPAQAGMPLLPPGAMTQIVTSSSLDTEPSDDLVPSRPVPSRPNPPNNSAPTVLPPNASDTQRSKALTDAYAAAEPMCKWPAVNGVVLKAVRSQKFTDDEIRAALLRMAAENRSVTVDALRYELGGMPPGRGASSPKSNMESHLELFRKLEAAEQKEIA